MDTGARLGEIMKDKGLSASALSKLSGVSQTMISSIIRGENNPSVQTMYLLCDAMGVTMSTFFWNEDEQFLGEEGVLGEVVKELAEMDEARRQDMLELIRLFNKRKD